MKDFENRFERRRKLMAMFFIFVMTLIIAELFGAIIFGYTIISDPESVGEFFGRIMKGFSQSQ